MDAKKGLLSAVLVLGALAPLLADDFRDVFNLVVVGNPSWMAQLRAAELDALNRAAEMAWAPEVTVSAKGAPYYDQTGALETFPHPDYTIPTYPMTGSVSVSIPLFDPNVAAKKPLSDLSAQAARAHLNEAKAGAYADFLILLATAAQQRQLAVIREETAASYRDLATGAEKRLTLGAGSSKDKLRAEVASRQARLASDQALQAVGLIFATWPAGAWERLEALGGWDAVTSGERWTTLLAQHGISASGVFDDTPPSPALPVALPLDSEDLDRRVAEAQAATGDTFLPALSLFGKADFTVTPDKDFVSTWESTLQAGLQIDWPLLSREKTAEARAARLLVKEQRLKSLSEARELRERALNQWAQSWNQALGRAVEYQSTRRLADLYADALKTEMAAGSTTLDAVLQGWQLVYKTREDEITSRWEAVVAALRYLKEAGELR